MRIIQILDEANYAPHWKKFRRSSARAIIFVAHKLLMVQSCKYGDYKFPGGGIKPGESTLHALIREVKEETGYALVPGSIAEYGATIELRKGSQADEIFEHTAFYYTAAINEHKKSTPAPEDGYEVEYGYAPVIVLPGDAAAANERLLGIPEIPWVARDLAVLREILAAGV